MTKAVHQRHLCEDVSAASGRLFLTWILRQFAPSAKYTDPEVILAFYQRLFPFRYLFQWLNHSMKPSNDFGHREFAFTLQNDAYLRYQSFATGDL